MQFIRKTTLERTEPPLHYHTCIQHRETVKHTQEMNSFNFILGDEFTESTI